jgi:hypothetical protein
VELGNSFGHPRDSLATVREHVAREYVGDDEFDIVHSYAVVIDVRLQALQDETGIP